MAGIMGHADEKMLLRVYRHTNSEGHRKAVNTAPTIEFGKK